MSMTYTKLMDTLLEDAWEIRVYDEKYYSLQKEYICGIVLDLVVEKSDDLDEFVQNIYTGYMNFDDIKTRNFLVDTKEFSEKEIDGCLHDFQKGSLTLYSKLMLVS